MEVSEEAVEERCGDMQEGGGEAENLYVVCYNQAAPVRWSWQWSRLLDYPAGGTSRGNGEISRAARLARDGELRCLGLNDDGQTERAYLGR